jgi:hypothetical protein
MSVHQRQNVAYGLSQALIPEAPAPIAAKRSPTATDYAVIGTIWSNVLTNQVYILASIVANVATWVSVAGGAGVFSSLTVTPGPINLTGTTNINTAGNATTNIGTGGTGLVNIGNATSGTNISGPLTQSGGAVQINVAGTSTTQIGNATGNVTIPQGNLILGLGDVVLAAARVVRWTAGVSIIQGAGSPDGVVAAVQGSLYLRQDGTDGTSRAYINTDGLLAWTAIITAG